jgi:hypothetical protein
VSELRAGTIAIAILGLIFFNLMTFVVLTFHARNKINTLLGRCSIIRDHQKTFGGLGVVSDFVKIGLVGSIFTFTKLYYKKGLVDIEQVKAFPRRLRCLILVQGISLSFLMGALVIFNLWLYLFDVPRLSE